MSIMPTLPTPAPRPESRFLKLLHAARGGSTEARWLVVELFRKLMLTIANDRVDRDVMPREAASDVVQNTIIEAQRDLSGFHGGTEAEMRGWLRKMLVHNIENTNRKHRAGIRNVGRELPIPTGLDGSPVIADESPSASSQAVRHELSEALEVALGELKEHYREVIVLRNQEGLPYDEIARRMGRSEESTRKLWSRAVLDLSKKLRSRIV